jgi:chromosome segregation ATPase
LVKNLEDGESAKLELIKKHEMQLKVLNQNLANLRNELKSTSIQVQAKESEISDLKGKKLELEAKLSNSIEDRKILLDRCIASENMSENLKAQNIDLKRKSEDLLAGIHELGREHQTLQVII